MYEAAFRKKIIKYEKDGYEVEPKAYQPYAPLLPEVEAIAKKGGAQLKLRYYGELRQWIGWRKISEHADTLDFPKEHSLHRLVHNAISPAAHAAVAIIEAHMQRKDLKVYKRSEKLQFYFPNRPGMCLSLSNIDLLIRNINDLCQLCSKIPR